MTENKEDSSAGYKEPAVCNPSCSRLAELAASLSLDLDETELREHRDAISQILSSSYQRIYDLPEPKLPVKYPRTPGHRPSEQENPLGAWYWRCDIQGASSGKLHGKTIAIKDNIPVAGVPMMNGSRILESYIPDVDATVVSRVLDAGVRILGKATCENLCCSDWSMTSATGHVLNPNDKSRMVGGSSSGCAALIAAGEVDMGIGCDQGGSIRTPASSVGIVGLKPTFGLVSYTGIASMDLSLDHAGPMARTVHDTALLLEVIAGLEDENLDPRQPRDLSSPEYTKKLTGNIAGLRVGVVKEGFGWPTSEPDVDQIVRTAAYQLTEAGARVEDVSMPWHRDGGHIGLAISLEGMTRTAISGYGGGTSAKMFYDTSLQDALGRGLKVNANNQPKNVKMFSLLGAYLQQDYHGVFYSKAQNLARDLTRAFDETLKTYDVLVMPTITRKPPLFPPARPMSVAEYFEATIESYSNTSPFDVTGHPSLTINAGSSDGLPVGMMISGRKFDEVTVLNVAYAYEMLRDQKA